MVNCFILLASSTSDENAPPKPPRIERPTILGESQQQTSVIGGIGGGVGGGIGPTTYIVAQNPEILSQLLREQEQRGINPAAYNTPASAFNTLAVDFIGVGGGGCGGSLGSPKRKLKTKLFPSVSALEQQQQQQLLLQQQMYNQQQQLQQPQLHFIHSQSLGDTLCSSSTAVLLKAEGGGGGSTGGAHNCNTLSSLGTISTSSSSDIYNMSSSTPGGSKPASNYGTLDKVQKIPYKIKSIFSLKNEMRNELLLMMAQYFLITLLYICVFFWKASLFSFFEWVYFFHESMYICFFRIFLQRVVSFIFVKYF